jgi:hypothetical protein
MTEVMKVRRPRSSRKVLVASMGVATVTYAIACGNSIVNPGDGGTDGGADDKYCPVTVSDVCLEVNIGEFVGNLAGGDVGVPSEAGTEGGVGDAPTDSTVKDTAPDTIDDFPVANLVAHPG